MTRLREAIMALPVIAPPVEWTGESFVPDWHVSRAAVLDALAADVAPEPVRFCTSCGKALVASGYKLAPDLGLSTASSEDSFDDQ